MTIFGPANHQVGKESQRFGAGSALVPRTAPVTSSKTTLTPRRATEREKKFSLCGWETGEDKDDDGITAFVRRQNIWESKRGTRKQPEILGAEFYHPVTHQCPCVDDFAAFKKESLHKRFHPKDRTNNKRNKGILPVIPLPSNGAQNSGYGVITPSGFEQKDMTHYIEKDFDKREIENYREQKHGDIPDTSRSAPVVDINEQMQRGTSFPEPRGMTYLNIKKLLKFTSNDRKRLKIDDDEDEGYSSKTSSAEAKGSGSDTEGGNKHNLTKSKHFSSMMNLSEYPSEDADRNISAPENDPRIRFSYTHQPTILQLPDPNVQLIPERIKLEKKIEKEDNSTYARIKRAKELNRYYNAEQRLPREESTVYNVDNLKPMTLVLRKISIQDADKSITNIIPHNWSSQVNFDRPVSTSPVRMNTRQSRVGSAVSRIGSGVSRSGSSQSQPDPHAYSKGRPKSQYSRVKGNIGTFETDHGNRIMMSEEAELQDNYPTLEKQATSYCIGDLLPAVEKSIFGNPLTKGRPDTHMKDIATTASQNPPPSDGYVLLQKGSDLLSTSIGKNTLGPPPFRPNQTRHPLIRNVTVVVEKAKQMESANGGRLRTAVNTSKTGTFIQTPRIGSDKGVRTQLSPDKETKRKLKEAFTKFYQNRPKEIGKEFRRTQTMWQV